MCPGIDFAVIDPADPWVRSGPNRCEQVDDGTRTTPRSGRELFVAPRGCATPMAEAQVGLPAMTRLVPLRDDILVPIAGGANAALRLATEACAVRVTVSGAARGARSTAEISGGQVGVAPEEGRRATASLSPARPDCSAHVRAAAATPPRETRVAVKTKGRGHWRVKGRYSNAASYATSWTTIERCDRTVTRVHSGRVRVFDRVRRKTVDLGPGEQYVARARP